MKQAGDYEALDMEEEPEVGVGTGLELPFSQRSQGAFLDTVLKD